MIKSADDNAAIVALMNAASVDKVWVGLNDRGSEGTYHWMREDDSLSEVPLLAGDYTNWGSNEPSQATSGKDCVHVIASSTYWFTRSCDQNKASVCEGVAPPPSPPTPPTTPPPTAQFSCFASGAEDTMYSSSAISQHSTDVAALAACVTAGSGSCAGVAYNPGVDASIQWSARQTGGSTFTLNGVTWYAFSGCRRRELEELLEQRRRRLQSGGGEAVDESDAAYQASLPSGDWWREPYQAWARLRDYDSRRRLSVDEDHQPPRRLAWTWFRRSARVGTDERM